MAQRRKEVFVTCLLLHLHVATQKIVTVTGPLLYIHLIDCSGKGSQCGREGEAVMVYVNEKRRVREIDVWVLGSEGGTRFKRDIHHHASSGSGKSNNMCLTS